jgi:hypothetical protein
VSCTCDTNQTPARITYKANTCSHSQHW